MSGVRTRILLASGANGLSLAARAAEQLLLVPILLAAWSAQLFGEWLMLAAVPVYLALLDFGVVQAGSNELARRVAEAVLDDERVEVVTVEVRKLRPPVPQDLASSGIRLTRRR